MDEQAFNQFFREMRPKLFRYARRKLDVETAHEIALESMTTLWRKGIQTPKTPIDWQRLQSLAYRVAEGHMRNALRSRRKHTNVRDALEQQFHVTEAERDLTVEAAIPSEIGQLIMQLAQTDREVLSLYLDGYKTGEIALVLNCSPKAASMRIARARKNLHALIEEVSADESQ